jgi:predicted Zn-dependent protease
MKIYNWGYYILILLLFSNCTKLKDYIPLSVDLAIGKIFAEQAKFNSFQGKILDSTQYATQYQYLNNIKNQLLQSPDILHKNDFVWKLHIIQNDSTLNAYCVAGGYIYIYTGLIQFLDNEAQLAGVMAHEMAHADLRHTTLRMASEYGITALIALVTGGDVSLLVQLAKELLGLSFSREDEAQADLMAVKYMAATEYDPKSVGGFFEKLIKTKKDTYMLEFLSTHPASENRVKNIEKHWKDLGSPKGKLKEYEYAKFKESFLSHH